MYSLPHSGILIVQPPTFRKQAEFSTESFLFWEASRLISLFFSFERLACARLESGSDPSHLGDIQAVLIYCTVHSPYSVVSF